MAINQSREEREQRVLSAFAQARQDGLRFRAEGLGHRRRQDRDPSPTLTYDMRDWDQVVSYQPQDLVATVGAGLPLSHLNRLLSEHRQWIPLRVADGQDDTVGGAVAAGVDGILRGGYGSFRDRILGLQVLTPGFGSIRVGSQVVKSVAGYNLPRLFIGTRGALGVITEVTLKISPKPRVSHCWIWRGPLQELLGHAREAESLAAPWATLAFIRDWDQGLALRAEWHGRQQTVDYLVERLGPGQADAPLEELASVGEQVVLKGALPRRELGSLLESWGDGFLVAEWQSGGFFGITSARNQAEALIAWIRARSGGVEVLSGPNVGPDHAVPLPEVWRRLKESYDPDGILG